MPFLRLLSTNAVNSAHNERLQTAYNNFASDGKRVIGFAKKTFVAEAGVKFDLEKKNFPLEALTFLGVCAIADPPR